MVISSSLHYNFLIASSAQMYTGRTEEINMAKLNAKCIKILIRNSTIPLPVDSINPWIHENAPYRNKKKIPRQQE